MTEFNLNQALNKMRRLPCYKCGHPLSDHALLTGCKHCSDYCDGVVTAEQIKSLDEQERGHDARNTDELGRDHSDRSLMGARQISAQEHT